MNKNLKLFALSFATASVLCNTIILIFNKSFVLSLTKFIPEGNPVIRLGEIAIGSFILPVLMYMIRDEIKNYCEDS